MIQLDMFEVQLGAAILLGFETDTGRVRVLADGGVKARDYSKEHVLHKLKPILSQDRRRIDLIIGTHYDEDHLNGLVPVINDRSIDIGEAWMPPVANDAQAFPVDKPVRPNDLLAHQFAASEAGKALTHYLKAKRRDIETVQRFRRAWDQDHQQFGLSDVDLQQSEDPHDIAYFRALLGEVGDDEIDHGLEQEVEQDPIVAGMVENAVRGQGPFLGWPPFWRVEAILRHARGLLSDAPDVAMAQLRTLDNIEKGLAKDAINAKALHAVVQALSKRKISIRTEIIDDGQPRTYRWDAGQERFLLAKPGRRGLTLSLLGPSRSLVKKHRDRLPTVEAAKIAFAFRGEIRSITPSNQLSYIGCFDYAHQRILVAGDAGCVDFKDGANSYYPALIAELKPLRIVQVAHHAGDNGHFYRVLAAADFPDEETPSYLLLSHACHDKSRPSEMFHDFIMTTLGKGDDVSLLFTSEPNRDKVVDFLSAIYPRVGSKGTVGDVRMVFNGLQWSVKSHAIEV